MTDQPALIAPFIARWRASGAAERANCQPFLSELCDVLEVDRPNPTTPDEAANAYVFEKSVPLPHGATGRIDLYRRGCFVLEAKQGRDGDAGTPALSLAGQAAGRARKRGTALRGAASWDTAMERARQQAQSYARNLPPAEVADGGRPPFLIVADVGDSLALYSEFTRSGGNYVPFPDPAHYRISLTDLADPDVRTLLRQLWLDPMSLDPSRRSARVTRDIADRLARLARALEGQHDPQTVAHFLMRCLFTMFAEDVGLLPRGSFTQLLADARHNVAHFPAFVQELWRTMAAGGFSLALRVPIKHFDGGLFADASALPLSADQLQLLIEAAQADWRDVEPAIFGTLLERALDPAERHKLGAHFTPRAYVERLVLPTLVEPLRGEWEAVQAAAARLADEGEIKGALAEVEAFQRRLASVRVLDPACGTGNFLYVSLEHLVRLQAEVLEVRGQLGGSQMLLDVESVTVSPRQFLGLEISPRAAAIAELVLWIGYLQWRLRTEGDLRHIAEPIIRSFHNIECRDAVLAWDAVEPLLDAAGRPVTRWDGRTTKLHPVTGEPVPDETGRVPAWRYVNPRPAAWPQADFVVGNPPFIGAGRMREALGDGYAETIRRVYPNVPDSADYVMFWWDKAADLVRRGQLRRFGFITTNSLRQTFNRRVLQHHLGADDPLSLVFAIPDHPWVDTADGAAVRISITVAEAGESDGSLTTVVSETPTEDGSAKIALSRQVGRVFADLTIGVDITNAQSLRANSNVSNPGVKLHGSGFIVTPDEAKQLGLGRIPGLEKHIRLYRNGRDLTATSRNVMVIDLFGLTAEDVRRRFPEVYQWVYERVKPERDQNNRKSRRENWWLFGETNPKLRDQLSGLSRYIATVETSRHRFFVFLDKTILPDNKLVNIALEDGYFLGVLSSRIHTTWALKAGGWLGVGNDPVYVKTACFEKFSFPATTDAQKTRIRAIAEELDSHRKRQQALHPKLTLTDQYNVL
ncbi:MAG: DNA methyltransferase, partial [Anaerolineae bacterium]